MSFDNSRCKAFCDWIEMALWVLIFSVTAALWCFSIYKFVEAL